MKKFRVLTLVLTLLLTFGAADSFAQKKTVAKKPVLKKKAPVKKVAVVPTIKLYTVETGQKLRVRLNNDLSSKTSKVGDTFTATVTEAVYANGGFLVIPSGSTVTGKVTTVTPAARGGKPGTLDVTFFEVKTPVGIKRAINGTLTELDGKNAKSDAEGTASGGTIKHRKVIFIGGGAGVGAVLGAAIGGGVGTAIGAGAGAGAGILADRLLKGSEAQVKSGTEFGVYLNQAISLPKFVEPVE